MKKFILAAAVVALAALNVQSATHAKVQLWEGGPYWATTNIGADNPWDYGLYFWWGDTTGYRPSSDRTFNFNFSPDNSAIYTYGKSVAELQSAGWVTSDGVLAPTHDAAHIKWGGAWRMPTQQELQDLCRKCDWAWTTLNGVNGYVVRGRSTYTANSIFLPIAGEGNNNKFRLSGLWGEYLSSAPWTYSTYAYWNGYEHYYGLFLVSDSYRTAGLYLYKGNSIRPVQDFNEGAPADCVVHFNANGGVFKDKDGNAATEFDQHFTYGESKPLFTDELTPMRMDGNGNIFLGWSKGTPSISSSDQLIASGREWTWDDDETEVTFYAVWTTTVTVWFYNERGDKSLSPSSLVDHLWWSVDDGSAGGRKTLGCGESIEVCPGLRTVKLHLDNSYYWIAGRFEFENEAPFIDMVNDTFELNIGNDFSDPLSWSTPRPSTRDIYVKAVPPYDMEKMACVRFICSNEIRESLRDLIKAEDVPFYPSKLRITIGRADYNESGSLVPMKAYSLTGLEAYKTYYLPKGYYYVKYEDVTYEADMSVGEPYWGVVQESNFGRQLFELSDEDDEEVKEITIRFDVFGGHDAVRVVFDPQGGECARPDMWFLYNSSPYSNSGWISIDKKTEESLPTPKKGEDFKFLAWFTERSGGLEFKSGATISLDKVHWVLPFEHTFYAYARWTNIADYWMYLYPNLVTASGGDIVTAAKMTAANGCRTVGECYALGIDPEDPDDDFKVTHFEMKDGKPVITLNHTEDGSGNSFLPRVKTLGKADLSDAEWREVPEDGDDTMRFFKVEVEMP